MAFSGWTLACNGVEKELFNSDPTQPSWLILDDFSWQSENKGPGAVKFRTAERFDNGATQFLYKQPATIWRGRTAIGIGGTIWFSGYFDDPERLSLEGKEYVSYMLRSAWWLMERCFFAQHRKLVQSYSGGDQTKPIFADAICSEVYLGEALQLTSTPPALPAYQLVRVTNGAAITEVIGWLNECYNPTRRGNTVLNPSAVDPTQDVLQIGAIEPAVYMPLTRANSVKCSEAVRTCLRLQMDVIVWIDTTTAPPTFYVRTVGKWNYGTVPPTFVDYTNLPEVILNITALQERQLSVKPMVSMQLPGVIIAYHSSETITPPGVTQPILVVDKFPATIGDYEPEAVRLSVELAGSSESYEVADVTTEALSDLLEADQAGQVAWWIAHDKTLQDPKIDPATIVVDSPQVIWPDGTVFSEDDLAGWPNILTSSFPAWLYTALGLTLTKARIQSEVAYTKYVDDAHMIPDTKPSARLVSLSKTLTTAQTQTYSALKAASSGDIIPVGVAESVARGLALLQVSGTITFTDAQLRSDIVFGKRYRLVGPNTTFFNCLPQSISGRPCYGETTVVFGPVAPVDGEMLIELAKAVRGRTSYRMPSGRADGSDGNTGAEVDTGADTPDGDTAHGVGGNEADTVASPDTEE